MIYKDGSAVDGQFQDGVPIKGKIFNANKKEIHDGPIQVKKGVVMPA